MGHFGDHGCNQRRSAPTLPHFTGIGAPLQRNPQVFHVAPPETFDKVLQDRTERQAEYRSDLYRKEDSYPDTVAIKTSGASFGAFVWIRDGAQMIVSFLNGEQDDEFTFRTDNKQIGDFFSKDFDDRFKKAAACTLETNQRGWLLH